MGEGDPLVRRFAPKGRDSAADAGHQARELALRILHAVDSRNAFADRILDAELARSGLAAADRGLVTQLVQGTIRLKRRLDWVGDALVRVDRASLPLWIQLCLRLGIYQLLFLDQIPRHAAVDTTVALANKYGHPGTAGLVNAVLRRLPEAMSEIPFPNRTSDPVRYLGVVESHPDWLVRRWIERYGFDRARSLAAANNTPSRVVVRVNTLRTHRDEVVRRLHGAGIRAEAGSLSPSCLRLESAAAVFASQPFRDGWISVQDESEALVVPLLNPRPGERILDLCAGPGGKLAHAAEWSRGRARLVGVEPQPARLARTVDTLRRLGHLGVALVRADGRFFGKGESFDGVLVDAPCSGLGVLRRRTDARWRKNEASIPPLVALQGELLDRAAALVQPGGRIVYSVCSFEPDECDEVVDAFLARHRDFQVERPGPGFPAQVLEERGFFRVLHDRFDTDGVFAVRLRRRAD